MVSAMEIGIIEATVLGSVMDTQKSGGRRGLSVITLSGGCSSSCLLLQDSGRQRQEEYCKF